MIARQAARTMSLSASGITATPQSKQAALRCLPAVAPSPSPSRSKATAAAAPQGDVVNAPERQPADAEASPTPSFLQRLLNSSPFLSFASPESDFTAAYVQSPHQERPSEVQSRSPLFVSFDENKDGVLSRGELIRGIQRLGLLRVSVAEAHALFDRLDTDGNGTLSEEEFYRHAWEAHAHSVLTMDCSFETGLCAWHDAAPTPPEASAEYQRAMETLWKDESAARVITEAHHPFHIVHVNDAWESLCGYKSHEVVGKSLGILQGPATCPVTVKDFMGRVSAGEPAKAVVTNYTKTGTPFENQLDIKPVHCDQGNLTHFVGTLSRVPGLEEAQQQCA